MDKVHVNDFIYNLFGPNENYRHNKFKALFAFQNHLIKPTPKTKYPNWRVQTIPMLTEFIFLLIWILGVAFSIYETTIRFKVHHADKKG